MARRAGPEPAHRSARARVRARIMHTSTQHAGSAPLVRLQQNNKPEEVPAVPL